MNGREKEINSLIEILIRIKASFNEKSDFLGSVNTILVPLKPDQFVQGLRDFFILGEFDFLANDDDLKDLLDNYFYIEDKTSELGMINYIQILYRIKTLMVDHNENKTDWFVRLRTRNDKKFFDLNRLFGRLLSVLKNNPPLTQLLENYMWNAINNKLLTIKLDISYDVLKDIIRQDLGIEVLNEQKFEDLVFFPNNQLNFYSILFLMTWKLWRNQNQVNQQI